MNFGKGNNLFLKSPAPSFVTALPLDGETKAKLDDFEVTAHLSRSRP